MIPYSRIFILYATLSTLSAPSLDNYGFLGAIFIFPFSMLLYGLSVAFQGSIGLSIIVLTILVRSALLPLVIQQKNTLSIYKEWKADKAKLDEKYKNVSDPQKRRNKNQEINELSKRYNFKPFKAGCMPFIYQAIILISLFQSIIRENQFSEQRFLWFTLGEADSFYILNLMILISIFIQMKITNPEFIKLKYIFAISIGALSLLLPSAICLYLITTNIFIIGQYLVLNKFLKEERSLKSDTKTGT